MGAWLVTGASGFFGYFMCKKIIEEGEECVGLDIEDFEYRDLKDKVKFYKVDIRDKENLERVFKENKIDYVIHAAAALPRWKPKDIISTNVFGSRNVLEFSLKYGGKRFVFTSSTAVYGIPKVHPVKEDYPLNPINLYAFTKVITEKDCERYREKGLDVLIIRPKTFVGPLRLGIFSILFDWIYRDSVIPIIGLGNNKYQLLDVRDLVEIIYKLTKFYPREVFNDVYNVGAYKFGTILSHVYALIKYSKKGKVKPFPSRLVKSILKILDKLRLLPIYEWAYETVDKDNFVSIEKLISKTGLIPKISSEKSLLDSYKWYEKHRKEFISKRGVTHRVQWYSKGLEIVRLFLLPLKYI